MDSKDLSFLEIAREDDSLLDLIPIDDTKGDHSNNNNNSNGYFKCSPLQLPRSNPIGMKANEGVEDKSGSFYRDSINKENFNLLNKEEATKLSIEPQQMKKRKKKGGGYNLRKSLAWDRAFFTEEGVLDPVELSMISGNVSKFSETLLTITEEGTNCDSNSSDLRELEENLFTDLPMTTSEKCRKDGGSLLPKIDSSVNKNDASSSVTKRKVLSAHDVNRSGSKRSGCPRPVAPSSLKRPANSITTKTSAKDSKVCKLPIQKPSPSKTSKTSTPLGASDSKRNQITQPASNIQKKSGLKGSSNNTKNVLNNSKSGSAGKSLTTKTSLGQAKRNVASSIKRSTNLQLPSKTEANNNSKVVANPSLPPTGLASNVPDGGFSKTALPRPKIAYGTGVNTQHAQLQTAKPSGLRMPSPSLGFFGQSKAPPLQSPLKLTSQPCNLPESNISNLRTISAPLNPVFELRPPLAPRNLPVINRDGSLIENVEASCSSSGCSVFPAVNPALHETVESNSQVTNMQMEKTVLCNDTSYEAVKGQKELHSTFIGVDQQCPVQGGQRTTAIFSMEDVKLQRNGTNLLQKDIVKQLDKYDIGTKVGDSGTKFTEMSQVEIPQITSHSSSTTEVIGHSVKNEIMDHQLAENRPYYSSLKGHGVFSKLNSGKCNESFGEQVETMNSLSCEAVSVSSDSQMLQDNAAGISSKFQDCSAAESKDSHAFSHLRSIEQGKEDYGVSLELSSRKCNVDEPFGEHVEMMNCLTCECGPISSDSQMLRDNAADINSKVQDYNVAEIENSHTFSSLSPIELEKEDFGVFSDLNSQKCNVDKPFAQQGEMMKSFTYEACSISGAIQRLQDNAADICSKVQDYNAGDIENSHTISDLRTIEQEKEDSTAVDVVRKLSNVEDAGVQLLDGNIMVERSNSNVSIFINNQHKMVLDHVLEKPESLEFPKSALTSEYTLQDGVILQVDDCLIGDKSFSPEESKQEDVLPSDEREGSAPCEIGLESSNIILMPVPIIDCGSNAAEVVQCHNQVDTSSVVFADSGTTVIENFNLNTQFQHDVELHDQSTTVELGNMDEDHLTDAASVEEVNVTCQKSGHFVDSETENPYITSEPSLIVQVEGNSLINHATEHDVVEEENFNLSVESSCHISNSQPGDDFCPCNEDSPKGKIYKLGGENDYNKVQEDHVKQIAACLRETETISNEEKGSPEAPSLSFEHSHLLEELQTSENGKSTNDDLKVDLHVGNRSESPVLSLHNDIDQAFKESEGCNCIIKEQDSNSELQNPVNQTEEVSSARVPEDEDDVTREQKKSGIDKKQDGLVIKPPLNAAPFSDEWLAAFEAAGEEVLTMKSGAVQNSPPEKSQTEPGPWSPVKRKHNQAIGPYDCTKYTNTNP